MDLGEGFVSECSGVIIKEKVILTAQHCVLKHIETKIIEYKPCSVDSNILDVSVNINSREVSVNSSSEEYFYDYEDDCGNITSTKFSSEPIPARNITVAFGLTAEELNQNQYQVEQVILAPGFNLESPDLSKDLAILKLEKPIKNLNAIVSKLPTKKEHKAMRREFTKIDNKKIGSRPKNIILEGWGGVNKDFTITPPPNLGYIPIEFDNTVSVDKLLTVKTTGREHSGEVGQEACKDKVICTVSEDGNADVCYGDSGGPAFWSKKGSGKPIFVGIASKAAFRCSGNGSKHVDVANHRKWITDNR